MVQPDLVVDSEMGAKIDLLAVPNGAALYDQLRERVGARRRQYVEALVNTEEYRAAAEANLAGPNSVWAMEITDAIRLGKKDGTEEFMAMISSPAFDWEPYGGDPTRDLVTGAKAAELMLDNSLGIADEEQLNEARDMGLRGIPTRGQLAPREGGGSDVKKQADTITGETTYVPNI